MSYGLEIYSNSGKLQISHDYQNLALVKSGSLSFSGSTKYSDWNKSIDGNNENQILAIRPSDTMTYFPSTNGWTIQRAGNASSDNGDATCDYWIFGPASDGQKYDDSSYGLQVLNSGGEVCFDSRLKYMRVVKIVTKSSKERDKETYSSDGRKYAMMMGSNYRVYTMASPANVPITQVTTYLGGAITDGDGIAYDELEILTSQSGSSSTSVSTSNTYATQFYGLVIDVTGL